MHPRDLTPRMTDHDRHAAANAEQVRVLRTALEGERAEQERPPPLVFWVALTSAALGLLGNWLGYREVETLMQALVIAVPVVAGFGWAVWGR